MVLATSASHDQLATDLSGLLKSGLYSDCIITCGNDKYNVHKAIVCTRSEFLAGAMRFSIGKEAEDGVLNLSKDDPDTVKLMINYIYSGTYEPGSIIPENKSNSQSGSPHSCGPRRYGEKICPHHHCQIDAQCPSGCLNFVCLKCANDVSASSLTIHAKLYAIADKYNVSGLDNLARRRFAEACILFRGSPEFKEAALYVYQSTRDEDMGLRDIIFQTISTHMRLIQTPEIDKLMSEVEGLAYKMLKEKTKDLVRILETR